MTSRICSNHRKAFGGKEFRLSVLPPFKLKLCPYFTDLSETQRFLEMKKMTLAPTPGGKKKTKNISDISLLNTWENGFFFILFCCLMRRKILPESFSFSPFLVRLRKAKQLVQGQRTNWQRRRWQKQVTLSTAGANARGVPWLGPLSTGPKRSRWWALGTTTGSLRQSPVERHCSPIRRGLELDSRTRIQHRKGHVLRTGGWRPYQTRGMAPESERPARRPTERLPDHSRRVWAGL